jgi:hypothetical protein
MKQKKFAGINDHCENNAIKLAFKRAGIKVRIEHVRSWPRLRGPKGLRIEMKTGNLVEVVR